VFYQDTVAAINWRCDAFGFEVRIKVQGKNGSTVRSIRKAICGGSRSAYAIRRRASGGGKWPKVFVILTVDPV
jgi:hypothetical protein